MTMVLACEIDDDGSAKASSGVEFSMLHMSHSQSSVLTVAFLTRTTHCCNEPILTSRNMKPGH